MMQLYGERPEKIQTLHMMYCLLSNRSIDDDNHQLSLVKSKRSRAMQQRNVRGARGVQIEEVCSAADEILARGERPTIERVRLQLGRGSPNTVGPMLESWYATLGKRLQPASEATQQEGGGGTELPPPVIRAAKALWGRALQLASEQATEEVAATMLALEGKAESLRQEEERLRQEEQRINDRSNALELAVIAKDQQISDLGRQLQETQQRFVEHTESIAELRAEAMKLRHAADAERRSKEQRDEEHRKERERLAEQAVANEKRLLAEVDRARQEAKKLQQQIEADARTSAKALADGQEKLRSTSLRLDVIEVEKSALTRELQSARDEVNAIRSRAEEGNARLAELLDLLRDRLPPEASHSKPSGRRPRTSPRRRS